MLPVCKRTRIGPVEYHAALVDIEMINACLPRLTILAGCDGFLRRSRNIVPYLLNFVEFKDTTRSDLWAR